MRLRLRRIRREVLRRLRPAGRHLGHWFARIRTGAGSRPLLLADRRGIRYEVSYGDRYAYLAILPAVFREFTDDAKVIRYLERSLRGGETVLDLGASIGAMTLISGRLVGEAGRVLAVEAEARNFETLRRNIELNGLPNIQTRHLAIANYNGSAVLNVFPRIHDGWHSLGRGQAGLPVSFETVTCTTIDDLLQGEGIARVDLMKIDIEGAEPEAFAGARHALSSRSIRRIIFEISQSPLEGMGHTARDVFAPLLQAGYSIYRIQNDGTLFRWDTSARAPVFANMVALPE